MIVCKFEEGGHWVCARGEHEYEGGGARAVIEGIREVKGRGLNEALPQIVDNKLLHSGDDLQICEVCLKILNATQNREKHR